jgi:hypothetical protein
MAINMIGLTFFLSLFFLLTIPHGIEYYTIRIKKITNNELFKGFFLEVFIPSLHPGRFYSLDSLPVFDLNRYGNLEQEICRKRKNLLILIFWINLVLFILSIIILEISKKAI